MIVPMGDFKGNHALFTEEDFYRHWILLKSKPEIAAMWESYKQQPALWAVDPTDGERKLIHKLPSSIQVTRKMQAELSAAACSQQPGGSVMGLPLTLGQGAMKQLAGIDMPAGCPVPLPKLRRFAPDKEAADAAEGEAEDDLGADEMEEH